MIPETMHPVAQGFIAMAVIAVGLSVAVAGIIAPFLIGAWFYFGHKRKAPTSDKPVE